MSAPNSTELKYADHVIIHVNLAIGEKVKIKDHWGPKFRGKTLTIEDVKISTNCESGAQVKLKEYENYIDSNWIVKIAKP